MRSLDKSARSSSEIGYPDIDYAARGTTVHREGGMIRGLGTGAIASPMAVSFREEKLALRTGSTSEPAPLDGTPSIDGRDP